MLAYSEGLSALPSVGPGTPISTSPPVVQHVALMKYADGYSAQFKSLLISGETIPFIELSVYAQSALPNPYHFNRYENCIITSISDGGSGGESITTENITFAFTKAC